MGQRGPKSTASKVLGKDAVATWEGEPPWQAEGLQRWERVVEFINVLPITSGKLAGQKMKLRPWQVDIVRQLYQVDKKGRRVVRNGIVTMPRKQGKTQLLSALIMASMGIGPEAERRGQCFSCANDRLQAALVFTELEAWIYACPEFTDLFNVKRFEKKIECNITGTVYQAMSRDSRKAHGLSPGPIYVYDEAAQSPDSRLWDNLSSGTGARVEPLGVIISTQAADDQHWFSQLIDYGRKIQTGELPPDPSFLLIEYSAPMDADIWDPETWKACNPALGDFRDYDELADYAERARKVPAMQSVFQNLYLNQRCSSEPRFISLEDWQACSGEGELMGPCYGGLDLGAVRDLTGLVLYWPLTGAVRCWAWMPGEPSLRHRAEQEKAPYDLWEKLGYIKTFPGKATDWSAAAFTLMDVCSRYQVAGVAFDRWQFNQMEKLLSDEGADIPLVAWGQGYRDMGPAVSQLERVCLDHKLRHGDNPVLAWCMSNISIETDPAGGRKFSKSKPVGRIDLAQALAMAVGLSARQAEPQELDFENSLAVI